MTIANDDSRPAVMLSLNDVRAGRKKRKDRDSSLDRNFLRVPLSALKPSKSTSNLANRGLYSEKVELSTEGSIPGVLKVFGDSVVPGTNYKSVLATLNTAAHELVQSALERYGIHEAPVRDFVLCEVVGRLTDDLSGEGTVQDFWTEECVRLIGMHERPLVLQQFWKPTDGCARRFELRRRTELMAWPDSPDLDSPTSIITSDGHSLLSQSPYSAGDASDRTSLIYRSDSDVTLPVDIDSSSMSNGEPVFMSRYDGLQDLRALCSSQGGASLNRAGLGSLNTSLSHSVSISGRPGGHVFLPRHCPYLVTLRGADPDRDAIVYRLRGEVISIGSQVGGEDIRLYSEDILSCHCSLRLEEGGFTSADDPGLTYLLQPEAGADVRINGSSASGATALRSDDVITLGEQYLLLYKDCRSGPGATSPCSQLMSELRRPPRRTKKPPSPPPFQRKPTMVAGGPPPGLLISPRLPQQDSFEVSEWRRTRVSEYDGATSRLKLSYCRDKEDALVDTLLALPERPGHLYPLTVSYLTIMTLEYCAVRYDQVATRTLMLKLADRLRDTVKDTSLALQEKHREQEKCDATSVLGDMHSVMIWLTNLLEMHNHIRTNMNHFLVEPCYSSLPSSRASLALAEDEIISGLEESVIHAFQHVVYYLTKALYSCLPALLESNPFSDADDSLDAVLALYQTALESARSCELHPQITSQLFCYLFFFTSTSLFNLLMVKDAATRYFKWSRGAQLRGNLDALETWATGNNLQQEATGYLRKINCLADLLATPKVQLLQADWRCLRPDFPALTAAQLHHVLSFYQLDSGIVRPSAWLPTPEDVQFLERSGELLESYNQHPPLILPPNGYKLNLLADVTDKAFHQVLNEITASFAEADDDDDSGLSVSHRPSSSQDQDALLGDTHHSREASQNETAREDGQPDASAQSDASTGSPVSPSPDEGCVGIEATADDSGQLRKHALTNSWCQRQLHSTPNNSAYADPSMLTPSEPDETPIPPARKNRNRQGKASPSSALPGEMCHMYIDPGSAPRTRAGSADSSCSLNMRKVQSMPEYVIPVYDDRLPIPPPLAAEAWDQKRRRRHRNSLQNHMWPDWSRVYSDPMDYREPYTPSDSDSMTHDSDDDYMSLGHGEDAYIGETFIVRLTRGDRGLGLGLIDGMYTKLRRPGIFVGTLVPGEAAASTGMLSLGDRILAVNGSSLLRSDYQGAMDQIRDAGEELEFLVAKCSSNADITLTI